MAHEIDMTTGRAAITYAGKTPWHKLGTQFDDLMTSQQALEAAGLNFTVTKEQACYVNSDGQPVSCPGRYVTVRNDTGAGLGTVGEQYSPVQNSEAFDFLDSLVATGGVRYEVAGALYGGKTVWMLAKLPSGTVISHDDIVDNYLFLSNSHDGKRMCSVAFTTVRVVCANTFRLANAGRLKHEYKIRHSGKIADKLAEAQQVLGLAAEAFDECGVAAKALSFKNVRTQQRVDEFLFGVLGVKGPDDLSKQQRQVKEHLEQLYAVGAGSDLSTARDTYWGLFNAVTEFVDHARPQQKSRVNDADEYRAKEGHWGGGNDMKQRAWELALAAV